MTPRRPHPSRTPAGFTLIEVVLSCFIVAIVLLATQSAMVIVARATPDGKTGPSARLAAGRALAMMADDLAWATSITSDSGNEIICVVPDRNGNALPETIRYFWNGVPGTSLYRQLNGAGSVSIGDNVQEFQLAYDTTPVSVSGGTTQSAETLLSSYAGSGLLPVNTNNNIDPFAGVGEYFVPSLPSNAVSWKITRVVLYMQAGSKPANCTVNLLSSTTGLPDGGIIDTSSIYKQNLPASYQWLTASFSNAIGLDPHAVICLQVQGTNSNGTNAIVQSQTPGLLGSLGAQFLLKTPDGGATWSQQIGQSMLYYVFGTYTTPNPPASQSMLSAVRCTLRCGNDPASRVVDSIETYNQPSLPWTSGED